ncbi:TetR-like C-terminal domain-containing protein [Streptomyces sp. KMM 9044]|uniref:TetR-like C-terminal domain-containing protein n=1 Tax=Streptomyces sp. KMM 9044 TaxID=2744474 RepID=UPI00217182D9
MSPGLGRPAGRRPLDVAPDAGDVRGNLPALCPRARDGMFSRPGPALRSVIHECDSMQVERFRAAIFEGVVEPAIVMLREVIERGTGCGEIRAGAANSYVFEVVPAMRRYRSEMCGSE